jgi:hypothetical protein
VREEEGNRRELRAGVREEEGNQRSCDLGKKLELLGPAAEQIRGLVACSVWGWQREQQLRAMWVGLWWRRARRRWWRPVR